MSQQIALFLLQQGSQFVTFIPLLLIFALFYFLILVPQRKRQRAIDEMLNNLKAGDKVVFGATVELYDVEADKDVTYQIVGELEADIKHNLISVTSPIARALIGKTEGDSVDVRAPGGIREYEIVAVRYE